MPARPQDAEAAKATAQTLAHALRSRRFARSITQAELAEQVGISLEAYSRLERGQSLPSFPTLMRVCEILETTPNALLLDHHPEATGILPGTGNPPRVRNGAAGPRDPQSERPPHGFQRMRPISDRDGKPEPLGRRPLAIRNPPLPDEGDEPAGLAPEGRVKLGEAEQERLDLTVELLRRLDRADRAAIEAVVRQLARRAGVLR